MCSATDERPSASSRPGRAAITGRQCSAAEEMTNDRPFLGVCVYDTKPQRREESMMCFSFPHWARFPHVVLRNAISGGIDCHGRNRCPGLSKHTESQSCQRWFSLVFQSLTLSLLCCVTPGQSACTGGRAAGPLCLV